MKSEPADTLTNDYQKHPWTWIQVEGRGRGILAVLLTCICCITGFVLYHIDDRSLLYFGDAASHLVMSRQFIDSQRPGVENIGTVWLPLPQLVFLPFVAIDGLFYSGIAGLLVGIPCFVGTGILIFLIVRRITNSTPTAILSGCVFGFNPNIIYVALTPMSEPIFMVLVALGGYAFLRWLLHDGERWAWLCSLAVVLGSLCRYEAWLLIPLTSLACGFSAVSMWRRSDRGPAIRLVAIAGICWVGVLFWFLWNLIEYGDPLKFAHWTYAIAAGVAPENMRLSPSEALSILGDAFLVIFGPVVLLAAFGVLIPSGQSHGNSKTPWLLLLFFGLPVVLALTAILAGFVQVDQWRWNWRYVLTASLFLAVAGGIGFSHFCQRVRSPFARGVLAACLLAMPLVQITIPSVGVATFDDARRSLSDNTRFSIAIGEQLHDICRDGSIALVTGYSQAQRIMISSGLHLKQFHIIYNPLEKDILDPLATSERYIVIGKDRTPESAQSVDGWLSRMDELRRHYDLRLETEHFILLERIAGR